MTAKKLGFLLVVVLGLLLYAGSDRYGIRLGDYRLDFDEDGRTVDRLAQRFLNDIKFKDFEHAASLHTEEDQEDKDIPQLIERKFQVKPEALDIKHFELLRVEVSPDGDRGKTLARTHVRFLNTGQTKDVELILYWKKVDGEWFLDLSGSL